MLVSRNHENARIPPLDRTAGIRAFNRIRRFRAETLSGRNSQQYPDPAFESGKISERTSMMKAAGEVKAG
jgi:hypothetical protein